MTRVHALLLLCLAPPTLAGEGWIGRTVPPYPDGLVSNIGACVGSGPAPDEICAYSIATLDDTGGRGRYLYAGRAAERAGTEPRWVITDVIAYPPLGQHDSLSIATCEREGKADSAVVAVVDTRGAEEMYETVRWATRLEQGRFIEIPTAGIRCYNEGYGE